MGQAGKGAETEKGKEASLSESKKQEEKERKEEVKLLLDRKRPRVEKWNFFGGRSPVIADAHFLLDAGLVEVRGVSAIRRSREQAKSLPRECGTASYGPADQGTKSVPTHQGLLACFRMY